MVHTNSTSPSTMALSKKLSETEANLEQDVYLRQITHHFRGIDKPLKMGPNIETLQDLIGSLHREFATSRVNIAMVNHIMLSYKSNASEWKKFAKFDRYKYTRNLVDAGNGKFNLMVLCWGEGHASAIHDHADSHCFMKMLKGQLRETRYAMPTITADINDNADIGESGVENEMEVTGHSTIETNDVAYINDNLGLHRIENASHTDAAVSLHLYCPPFTACAVFQRGNRRVQCPVTFWSQYGVRQPQDK